MDVNPSDDVLAAWALDALDADELAAVNMAVDLDPALARAVAPLRRVAADLASSLATAPPGDLRERLHAAALAARPVGATTVVPTDPVEVYAAQVERLTELLAEVGRDDAGATVAAYGWTLDRLVRHLRGVEAHFLDILAAPDLRPAGPVPDHLDLGAGDDGAGIVATAAGWSTAAATAVATARRLGADDLARQATFHGLPFELATLFVVRAFELWTHADDVRRVLGRPVEAPEPGALRTMSDRAVRGLPSLMLLAGIVAPPVAVRVVLTGRGGGTWDVDLDVEADPRTRVAGPPRATVVADVVDFCRLVARRIAVDDLDHEVDGDRDLVRTILVGAQAIAV